MEKEKREMSEDDLIQVRKEYCIMHGHRWGKWFSDVPYYIRNCERCGERERKEQNLLHAFWEIIKYPFNW
jgi:hypothetical protein